MANTVTTTTVYGGGDSRYVTTLTTILGDGSGQVTDSIIYDNSAFVANVTKGTLVYLDVAATASTGILIEWDQTTDFLAWAGNGLYPTKKKFECFGGIKNPGGTGATGDLLVTTTGLASGTYVTILATIRQS